MALADDLDAILADGPFHSDVVSDGTAVRGHVRRTEVPDAFGEFGPVQGWITVLTIRTGTLPSIVVGGSLTVDGAIYRVGRVTPPGTDGLTRIWLLQ